MDVQDDKARRPSSFLDAVSNSSMSYEEATRLATRHPRLYQWQAAISSVLSAYLVVSEPGPRGALVVSCSTSPRPGSKCAACTHSEAQASSLLGTPCPLDVRQHFNLPWCS